MTFSYRSANTAAFSDGKRSSKDLCNILVSITVSSGQTMISVKKIVPFHNHPFRLYEGKRLDDMVESIREHGVLIPVIVQKIADGYEMLSGHNRWNAAKVVGIKEIPAIIKDNLTEREAYVYVIETNMYSRQNILHFFRRKRTGFFM